MKRYLHLLILFAAISCDDEESFPIEPQITLQGVTFGEGLDKYEPDTLTVSFSFTDGDGDLGLDVKNIQLSKPPFHWGTFFLKGTGAPVTSDKVFSGEVPVSELIWYEDRQDAPYDTLPELSGCFYTEVLWKTHVEIVYFIRSKQLFSLTVDFFYENDNGEFVEFDWWKEYCISFDDIVPASVGESRFFTKKGSSKKGELSFRMMAPFVREFGTKKMKLVLSVRDRASHESNVVETPPFYLADI